MVERRTPSAVHPQVNVSEALSPKLLSDTASAFGLLSAPARVHIVWLLANGDQDVGTLAEATGHSMATVSHHLGKLKLAGIVQARRVGKRQINATTDTHIVELVRLAVVGRLDERGPDRPVRHA